MSAQFRPQAAAGSAPGFQPQYGGYQPQYQYGSSQSASQNGDLAKNLGEKFELYSNKVEELVDAYSGPVKPYVPAIGRFLMVATFYEDAIRIVSQWSDQVFYLNTYRHIPYFIVVSFLFVNVVVMAIASTMLIGRKRPDISTCVLIGVVLSQGFFYGLFTESSFLLRSFSVIGGLLLAFSDSIVKDRRSLAGLPMVDSKDNKRYFLLAGRIMLVLLFIGFTFSSSWTFGKFFIIMIGSLACISIVIGFKTKFSAVVLGFLLSAYNISVNYFWAYGYKDPQRDFLRYEFFQTLSIVGGLLLIVNTGAGELSIDEKKKIY
ncbi:Erv29 protein [Saccharomycopsis crataegensis]|uniref:Erv29 protein n=1 Tax=Saccharomycopsis crataegensis TaxID=43959 RepID=A0AAV5QGC1_9ASCO|nr:Erv29 protein [Saccharomycopsis crataegensis]